MFRISNHKNSYDATFWCFFVHAFCLMFRKSTIPLVPIPDSPLCPVHVYLNMISLVVVSQDSPAFSIVKGKWKQPVTYRQFQSGLKHTITLLEKHSDDYSTHSYRREGATWAFSAEVPTELIQLYGD